MTSVTHNTTINHYMYTLQPSDYSMVPQTSHPLPSDMQACIPPPPPLLDIHLACTVQVRGVLPVTTVLT